MKLPRTSGILLHPTSLPGPYGSGDLGPAAYHFVDWLAVAAQKVWQVLPLGGIGPGNSPYMSGSAFAGNPLLIDLADLAARGWLPADELAAPEGFESLHTRYELVVPWRMARLESAVAGFTERSGLEDKNAFAAFIKSEASWLDDYCLFMSLGEQYQTGDWTQWPKAVAKRAPKALQEARVALAVRLQFHAFCQWTFFRQWASLKTYANEHGVRIIGDAPIFIAHQSAEVWARPELFKLNAAGQPKVVAGVPPDYFSATGQRWGNPLYDWKAHARENYAWWTERIRHSIRQVDILRIDHFRGFADYWEIPAGAPTAIEGRWVKGPGAALFEAIERKLGPLPLIAEDLGIITPEVEQLRKRFDLPGMRILQFAFGGDATNPYLPHNYEAGTVAYTGTHDNNTTLGWWSQATEAERSHVRDYLGRSEHEDGDIHWKLMTACTASIADTAIHPMQDVLGLGSDARMNLPGVGEGYWAWRFSWDQVASWHADRLAAITRLYGRA